VCVWRTYMEGSLPGSVGAARKTARGEGPQSWGVGCRSGNKRQRSAHRVCRVYVHGRVAPGGCRGSEEGGEGGKVSRAGAWAVGQATSVSGAHIVCVECTYVEESLPGSIGQRGRR